MNIRSYTDLKQSKKLLELGLSPESADMHYYDNEVWVGFDLKSFEFHKKHSEEYTPCWSLAALLELMPAKIVSGRSYFLEISKPNEVRYYSFRQPSDGVGFGVGFGKNTHVAFSYKSLVDAAFGMVLWLKENKHI